MGHEISPLQLAYSTSVFSNVSAFFKASFIEAGSYRNKADRLTHLTSTWLRELSAGRQFVKRAYTDREVHARKQRLLVGEKELPLDLYHALEEVHQDRPRQISPAAVTILPDPPMIDPQLR